MHFRSSQVENVALAAPCRTLLWLAAVLVAGHAAALSAQTTMSPAGAQSGPQSISTAPAYAPPALEPTGNTLIFPDDVLNLYVYDVPELSRDYAVNANGTITVPLLTQPVRAAGLTPEELARSLEESFRQSGRLSHPQITVFVQQSRRSAVTVEGAVRTPQTVAVSGPTLLTSVLAQCGGRNDDSGTEITVRRGEEALRELPLQGKDATPIVKVGFKELLDPNDPTAKFTLWPGDRVSVERAGLFYILGQVGRPGGYNLKSADEQVSVLQAIALAGDVSSIAKTDKAFIIRKDAKAPNGREEIALNLKSILHGTAPDRVLQADDILYVPTSSGKKAARTAAGITGSLIGTTAGAAIYTRF